MGQTGLKYDTSALRGLFPFFYAGPPSCVSVLSIQTEEPHPVETILKYFKCQHLTDTPPPPAPFSISNDSIFAQMPHLLNMLSIYLNATWGAVQVLCNTIWSLPRPPDPPDHTKSYFGHHPLFAWALLHNTWTDRVQKCLKNISVVVISHLMSKEVKWSLEVLENVKMLQHCSIPPLMGNG